MYESSIVVFVSLFPSSENLYQEILTEGNVFSKYISPTYIRWTKYNKPAYLSREFVTSPCGKQVVMTAPPSGVHAQGQISTRSPSCALSPCRLLFSSGTEHGCRPFAFSADSASRRLSGMKLPLPHVDGSGPRATAFLCATGVVHDPKQLRDLTRCGHSHPHSRRKPDKPEPSGPELSGTQAAWGPSRVGTEPSRGRAERAPSPAEAALCRCQARALSCGDESPGVPERQASDLA